MLCTYSKDIGNNFDQKLVTHRTLAKPVSVVVYTGELLRSDSYSMLGVNVVKKVTETEDMAEVRVHAAFTVKNEEEFLREAQKMIDATQVLTNFFCFQTCFL